MKLRKLRHSEGDSWELLCLMSQSGSASHGPLRADRAPGLTGAAHPHLGVSQPEGMWREQGAQPGSRAELWERRRADVW